MGRGARAKVLSVARQERVQGRMKGDVFFLGVCGLMFVDGSTLRRVAKALIPLDVSHLALWEENGIEEILNVKQNRNLG